MSWDEKYDKVYPFRNGLALVRQTIMGKYVWGFVNTNGEEVVPCMYKAVGTFINGFAVVRKIIDGENKYGYVNSEGKEVVPCAYGWNTIDQALNDYIKKEQIEKFLEV